MINISRRILAIEFDESFFIQNAIMPECFDYLEDRYIDKDGNSIVFDENRLNIYVVSITSDEDAYSYSFNLLNEFIDLNKIDINRVSSIGYGTNALVETNKSDSISSNQLGLFPVLNLESFPEIDGINAFSLDVNFYIDENTEVFMSSTSAPGDDIAFLVTVGIDFHEQNFGNDQYLRLIDLNNKILSNVVKERKEK